MPELTGLPGSLGLVVLRLCGEFQQLRLDARELVAEVGEPAERVSAEEQGELLGERAVLISLTSVLLLLRAGLVEPALDLGPALRSRAVVVERFTRRHDE